MEPLVNLRLQVLSPVYPPALGGIETLTEGIVTRWTGPVEVVTLAEPQAADWDAERPYTVHRVRNQPRGGRRSIARLTVHSLHVARAFRPDIVLSMHVRCGYAAALIRSVTGAAWAQYYHAKEVPTWPRSARWCVRGADLGIAVSRYTRGLVEAVGVPTAPLTVIPPGVRLSPPLPGARARRPTILTVSRLADAYKGHDVMLAALPAVIQRLPDVRWVVVGGGERLDWLRTEVVARGLSRHVELRGAVDESTRNALLAEAHIFALPSRVADHGRSGEGFGIVYVEAAAAGLPVVAGRCGGATDAVDDGVTGLLVDPTDPAAVAGALITLLERDELRGRMATAGPDWSRKFDWSRVSADVQAALQAAAARHTRAA
ncbi:glycosyltransferase family 4 protein [Dactylosporangium vinaceum]|uniref:Glycosyltransferase family 4 protein n=1 Tax=Dactylosporangium vinaceum TaxID=53362 RepID=A0ABV5MII8_9ACTN|nr:glycosyltransferase family 4 protein [Dactylosporangium vinaceum]UAB97610.1 glycosyltransferase family 4 protein [Dactylosporangium vinaceum]